MGCCRRGVKKVTFSQNIRRKARGDDAAARRVRAATTRHLILAEAARRFRESGYTASSLKDIAAGAGISAASFYYYFSSKEELLDEVLDKGCRQVIDFVSDARAKCEAEGGDFRRVFRAMVHAHLYFLLCAGDYTAASIRNFSMLPPENQARHRQLFVIYGNLWEELFDKAKASGELKPDLDTAFLQRIVIGALNWTVEWFDTGRYSISHFADRVADIMLDGLLRPGYRWQGRTASALPVEPLEEMAARQPKFGKSRLTILIAAARVLRARGYEGVTLRHIAEVAGMEAGSIYYHFSSKEEIIDEVLSRGLNEVADGVATVLRNREKFACPVECFAAAVRTHMLYLFIRNDFVAMNMRIYAQLPRDMQERHHPVRQRLATVWSDCLHFIEQSNEFREGIEIMLTRQLLLGALNWTALWFKPDRETAATSRSLDDLINMLLVIFLDGICVDRGENCHQDAGETPRKASVGPESVLPDAGGR